MLYVRQFRKPQTKVLRCTLLGDIALSGPKHAERIAKGEGARLFEGVLPYLRRADCVIANLETAVSDSRPVLDRPGVLLRSPKVTSEILQATGIHVVNLGNNHVMDCGATGLRELLENADAAGIRHFGAGVNLADARKTCFLNLDGIRLAMIGWAEADWHSAGRRRAGTAPFSLRKSHQAIRAARDQGANVVMFHWHGGEELYHAPWPKRVQMLRALARSGADIVVGNHQHIYQGYDRCDDAVILLSLGNFLFDTPSHRVHDLAWCSCMTTCLIDKNGCCGIELAPVEITPAGVRMASEQVAEKMFAYIDQVRRLVADRGAHKKAWQEECYRRQYEPAPHFSERERASYRRNRTLAGKLGRILRYIRKPKYLFRGLRRYLRRYYVIIRYSCYRSEYLAARKQLYARRFRAICSFLSGLNRKRMKTGA